MKIEYIDADNTWDFVDDDGARFPFETLRGATICAEIVTNTGINTFIEYPYQDR